MKIAKCISIVVAALLVVAFCGAATPKIDTGQSAVGAWFPIPCGTPCSGSFATYCNQGPEGYPYKCTNAQPLTGCVVDEGNPKTCHLTVYGYCNGLLICPYMYNGNCKL